MVGQGSCRPKAGKDCDVLLMTATPIADDPMEFINLMNLLIEKKQDRFTTNYNDFISQYVKSNWNFSLEGRTIFKNRLKGLISYLNRSSDPRQFTQPKFYKVKVPISNLDLEDTILEDCQQIAFHLRAMSHNIITHRFANCIILHNNKAR